MQLCSQQQTFKTYVFKILMQNLTFLLQYGINKTLNNLKLAFHVTENRIISKFESGSSSSSFICLTGLNWAPINFFFLFADSFSGLCTDISKKKQRIYIPSFFREYFQTGPSQGPCIEQIIEYQSWVSKYHDYCPCYNTR